MPLQKETEIDVFTLNDSFSMLDSPLKLPLSLIHRPHINLPKDPTPDNSVFGIESDFSLLKYR